MRRGVPRPTPSAGAVVLQVASLLVVASGLVVILISDIKAGSKPVHVIGLSPTLESTMLDARMSPQSWDNRHVRVSGDKRLPQDRMLARYIEGWAEANSAKILDATDAGYSFHDPFVGCFSRRTLSEYFERLQTRFARAGATSRQDLFFHLRGPRDGLSCHDEFEFWQEAPRVGLTGIAQIKASPRGVLVEISLTTSTWHSTFCLAPCCDGLSSSGGQSSSF